MHHSFPNSLPRRASVLKFDRLRSNVYQHFGSVTGGINGVHADHEERLRSTARCRLGSNIVNQVVRNESSRLERNAINSSEYDEPVR